MLLWIHLVFFNYLCVTLCLECYIFYIVSKLFHCWAAYDFDYDYGQIMDKAAAAAYDQGYYDTDHLN
jgi:hypothetical protein